LGKKKFRFGSGCWAIKKQHVHKAIADEMGEGATECHVNVHKAIADKMGERPGECLVNDLCG
jgi:hypothetical protein